MIFPYGLIFVFGVMKMNRQDEQNLVARVQNDGCLESFSKLLNGLGLYRSVYLYIRKFISNPSDVEELTQEVLFKAFEKIQGFDFERGRYKSWVLGIASHKVCDLLRSKKRQFVDLSDALPDMQGSPEELYERVELESYLLRALTGIQGRPLRILLQFYVDGLSHEDIGLVEGISANNVGTILYRTRNRWLEKYHALLRTSIGLPNQATQETELEVVQEFSSMFQFLNQQMTYQ